MNWSGPIGMQDPVHVTVPDQRSLLDDLEHRLRNDRGFSVATLNLDHAVKLRRNGEFRTAYATHTHITADGKPVVWLSRIAGQSGVCLVTGSDLILPVVELAEKLDAPVALVGATAASLEATARALCRRYAGLRIVLTLAPRMGFDPSDQEADDVIAKIRSSDAKLVFLALGAPKQELFAARAQADLPDVGFLSIGAGLDFISGAQKRAPQWVRAIAAEWLWRAFGDPRRMVNRYLTCLTILPVLVLTALRTRKLASSNG